MKFALRIYAGGAESPSRGHPPTLPGMLARNIDGDVGAVGYQPAKWSRHVAADCGPFCAKTVGIKFS